MSLRPGTDVNHPTSQYENLTPSKQMCLSGQVPRDSKDPITIGHEATGIVEEIGKNVSGFNVGDPVGFINGYNACWACRGCQGHFILCTNGKVTMQGFTSDGYFQEYAAIDAATAVVIPKSLDAYTAAPIFCAGVTGTYLEISIQRQLLLTSVLQPIRRFK